MRLRPIAALSAAAVSALLLAGCSGLGGGTPTSTPTDTPAAAVDLCDAAAAPGDASNAVTVDGEVGRPSTATFAAPLEVPELQTTLIAEGEGDATVAGDFVSYALSAFDAETGEAIVTLGYEPGELLPAQISADNPLGQLLGCGAPGTRVVATFPATDTAAAEVYVVDLLDLVPLAAWGTPEQPVDGLPAVTIADDGTPSIEIPEGDVPTETTVAALKTGDGYQVQSGDYVLIQYMGVRWSSGEEFDSTWADGAVPYSSATTSFVTGFQKALEGQTVGSQVLVVIPPAEGYGEGEINASDLKGETLVFVVDILGAQKATQ